ncbi:MAG TPA: hypothetical protein IGS53_00525 [Leptolyngbyaceae cyanobacterium M33_DOE_097]|uniref:Uncharacterized protein n=1 Tax=Oscillatoriales cyanobacterium SpSt-418 TaxID=2282169 RepID=A0A7C3KIW0_9CYAN|nr:hypothetical protein [Leptolyngbyaceae cyanobacterium M33_DOE_097]
MFHLLLPFALIGTPAVQDLESTPARYADTRITDARQYQKIDQKRALNEQISVELPTGKATVIDFLATGETILDILLADPSRITYTTDARTQKEGSKKPTAIYLRESEKTVFPGMTSAAITNMVVTTIGASGQRYRYNFAIVLTKKPTNLGIQITSEQGTFGDIMMNGQPISPFKVQKGLDIALQRRYTAGGDPVVKKVRAWVNLVSNGADAIASARRVGVTPVLLKELVKLAGEEELKERFQPSSDPPSNNSPTHQESSRLLIGAKRS